MSNMRAPYYSRVVLPPLGAVGILLAVWAFAASTYRKPVCLIYAERLLCSRLIYILVDFIDQRALPVVTFSWTISYIYIHSNLHSDCWRLCVVP